MRYLWQRSLLLDNRKLRSFLGEEPHTPLERALRQTLGGLGCMPPAAAGTDERKSEPVPPAVV